jgi:D-alanine-D-alanine ligase
MKKQKILVIMHESLVPPDSIEGLSQQVVDEWRTEYDVVTHLKKAGHDVRTLGVYDSLTALKATIQDWKPNIVFNLLEEFDGLVNQDHHVVSFLELLKQPYTGCNPRGLMLSRDKVLTKQLLSYHRIPSPQFAVFKKGKRIQVPSRLRYPLFVKSATDDASLGIAQASICHDASSLRQRIEFVHDQTSSDALVEEYVEGREIYVGVLGNSRLTTLPVWELKFGSLVDGSAPIATRRVKWDRRYQARHGIYTEAAQDLPDAVVAELHRLTRRICRALHLTGYARVDFRVRPDGRVFALEANANPILSQEEVFARSAQLAGLDYDALLARILSLGAHYEASWRVTGG